MMKKTLFGLIVGVMVFAMGCASTYKADNGTVLNYSVENGAVTILGCKGNPLEITIPAQIDNLPVTAIASRLSVMSSRPWGRQLTSITIPDSVTTAIGWGTFYEGQLTSVTIGNGVTAIEDRAFFSNQLTSVTIPNSVTAIGEMAFSGNQLTSVTIGNGVTTIGDRAFSGNQLTSVAIGNSVTTIGDGAFYHSQLTSVTIPNSVTAIGGRAFAENPLTSVTIGAGVDVADDAFPENLGAVYNRGGRRAGTYRYTESAREWH